jgi:hypothetical protein
MALLRQYLFWQIAAHGCGHGPIAQRENYCEETRMRGQMEHSAASMCEGEGPAGRIAESLVKLR